jgi:hypothetical protein
MGSFVRVDFTHNRLACGCCRDGSYTCAGHKDRPTYQRAYRAPVVPINKNPVTHFLAALNPFRKGPVR